MRLSQVCYNLALFPEESRQKTLSELQQSLEMDDEEFGEFRRELIDPMVLRHQAMFPNMALGIPEALRRMRSSSREHEITTVTAKTDSKPDRYGPCPCNSGRKYKFCCGAKGR